MKLNKFLVAFVCLLPTLTCAEAADQKVELFDCSNKQCDWVIIKDKTLLKEEKGASLYNVVMIWGHSEHKNGFYPKAFSEKIRIKWSDALKDEFSIFCYNKLPVYIVGGEFNILNFKYADTHAVKSAAMEYVRICYDVSWKSSLSEEFLKKHNLSEPVTDEISATKPEELFQYVK